MSSDTLSEKVKNIEIRAGVNVEKFRECDIQLDRIIEQICLLLENVMKLVDNKDVLETIILLLQNVKDLKNSFTELKLETKNNHADNSVSENIESTPESSILADKTLKNEKRRANTNILSYQNSDAPSRESIVTCANIDYIDNVFKRRNDVDHIQNNTKHQLKECQVDQGRMVKESVKCKETINMTPTTENCNESQSNESFIQECQNDLNGTSDSNQSQHHLADPNNVPMFDCNVFPSNDRVNKSKLGLKYKCSDLKFDNRLCFSKTFSACQSQLQNGLANAKNELHTLNINSNAANSGDNLHHHSTLSTSKKAIFDNDNTDLFETEEHKKVDRHKQHCEDSQNLIKNRNGMSRNDFHYKQRRSVMDTDNRVSFHSNTKPYVGKCRNFNISTSSSTMSEKAETPECTNFSKTTKRVNSIISKDYLEENEYEALESIYQPKTMEDWSGYAEQTQMIAQSRLQAKKYKRGRNGHDVVLVLDISERMKGSKFDQMRDTAYKYIEGKQDIYCHRGIEDSIGLVVFGGKTRLVHECTSDYELLKAFICQLEANGDGPLFAGLTIASRHCHVVSHFCDTFISGHIIVFTDGTSANGKKSTRTNNVQPSYLMGDVLSPENNDAAIGFLSRNSIRLFYVPIGEDWHNKPLEEGVKVTGGKIIPPLEIDRLIRMTQVMILAAKVASTFQFSHDIFDRDSAKRKIQEMSTCDSDANDDCIDMVLDFINPLSDDLRKGLYKEIMCRTLQLGDRVRRGPYWNFKDQDSNMPGTVIGQDLRGNIWVEWDSGYRQYYVYQEPNILSIRKVNEPRILTDNRIDVGCRVVRGPDWSYDGYDGGSGCQGTVLHLDQDGTVVVRWDCKRSGLYKVGCDGMFEVKSFNENDSTEAFQPNTVLRKSRANMTINQHIDNSTFNENNDHANDLDSTNTAFWEYKDNNTEWRKYPPELNNRIEKAFKNKKRQNIIITMGNARYIVDFAKMYKNNPITKEYIPLRRKE